MCINGDVNTIHAYRDDIAMIFLGIQYLLAFFTIFIVLRVKLNIYTCILSACILIWMCIGLSTIYATDVVMLTYICKDGKYVDITPRHILVLYYVISTGWVSLLYFMTYTPRDVD